MKKVILSKVTMEEKTTEITQEETRCINCGSMVLDREPNRITDDIIPVLKKYNLIADNDDVVKIHIEITQ